MCYFFIGRFLFFMHCISLIFFFCIQPLNLLPAHRQASSLQVLLVMVLLVLLPRLKVHGRIVAAERAQLPQLVLQLLLLLQQKLLLLLLELQQLLKLRQLQLRRRVGLAAVAAGLCCGRVHERAQLRGRGLAVGVAGVAAAQAHGSGVPRGRRELAQRGEEEQLLLHA